MSSLIIHLHPFCEDFHLNFPCKNLSCLGLTFYTGSHPKTRRQPKIFLPLCSRSLQTSEFHKQFPAFSNPSRHNSSLPLIKLTSSPCDPNLVFLLPIKLKIAESLWWIINFLGKKLQHPLMIFFPLFPLSWTLFPFPWACTELDKRSPSPLSPWMLQGASAERG